MIPSISLRISPNNKESNTEILERISSRVEEMGEEDNWPPRLIYLVNLTLEEFGINALTHGRYHGLDELEITIRSETHSLIIEMSDNGAPFDPLNDAPVPDPNAPLETRPIGGLGIYLIRKMVDDIHYRREDGRNRLTLITGRSR